jgi:drug/metabolite transporter (DMT)-like permease
MVTPRSVVALVLILGGIAWIVYYYVGVRPGPDDIDPKTFDPVYSGIGFFGDLKKWNYVIGFGAIMVGLIVAAHPSTPLGRGRGVVVGMLGCFLLGLLWICTYYVFSNDLSDLPVFNDLGQYNLMVGIGFMAVGFTYATRWE